MQKFLAGFFWFPVVVVAPSYRLLVFRREEAWKVSSGVSQSGEMGSCEEGRSDKSSSSPKREQQNNVHAYPDWAAMQAYYGHRVALPPPYLNSAVANGHPPPYMWGPPQIMMPPYGAPYAAIYPTGGVYAHPAVPYGSQPLGQGAHCAGAATVTLAATASDMNAAANSSENKDQGSVKNLKTFDDLAISIGNGKSEKTGGVAAENQLSQSSEGEGSSNGTGQSTAGAIDHKRKRSHEGTPPASAAENVKEECKLTPISAGRVNSASEKVLGFPVSAANGGDEIAGTVLSPFMATSLELRNPSTKANPVAVVSSEAWIHNERELKRERRKQSNRESARRSRLRKQAEAEELGKRVESLSAENAALRTEINQLVENSEKLRQENAGLVVKLKRANPGEFVMETDDDRSNSVAKKSSHDVSTEKLVSRVESCGATKCEEGGDVYDNSAAKLHPLLNASPRADAVASC
ncbi:hypothetical protein V2J09_004521 [Rumex salicifolius]